MDAHANNNKKPNSSTANSDSIANRNMQTTKKAKIVIIIRTLHLNILVPVPHIDFWDDDIRGQ